MVVSARTGRRALGSAARDLFGDAGGRLRRELSGADVLTQRERHVAELVAQGASNRDVAEQLFIRPRTVELHLTNVYRKLGVGRRSELVTALEADTLALGAGGDGRLGRAG
jgi:DNA-binding CsgD family transcriptional regulator